MRKSFVALALLVGAAAIWTTTVFAQEAREEGVREWNGPEQQLTRAARLGTSATTDTCFIGHARSPLAHSLPWFVGRGPVRPIANNFDGMWDFDVYDANPDSMQGWVPTNTPNTRIVGTLADYQRPYNCLDWGNRFNAAPIQGRTPGIVSAWHVDGGNNWVSSGVATASPQWTPLAGSASAWCGLRSGDDFSVVESKTLGGTGNAVNGEVLFGGFMIDAATPTAKLFPGYANQWDQMLYRDVRVATGGSLTVSFLYQTRYSVGTNSAEASCKGWFNKDPLSMQQGGSGNAKDNFISASGYLGTPVRSGPIDSFMVYVGVPTDPTACQYTDNAAPRPIFDLKRRWFSEVISVDKPYKEILSTFGRDSVYKASPFSYVLDNTIIQPMLDAQGAADGGGVLRLVFRSKTNADYSDETGTNGSFNSGTEGAVRIDQVAITGATPAFTTSGFETAGEIDNTVELANSDAPGPAVGQGYALAAWHSTGKPTKLMSHTHPLFGGYIGEGNYYSPLAWADLCGPPDSPLRNCNINNVIVATTDHDLGEAAGGAIGTPFKENRNGILSPTINFVTVGGSSGTTPNEIGLDGVHAYTNADWFIRYDSYRGVFNTGTQGNVWGNSIMSYPATQANGAKVWGDIGFITGVWSTGTKSCSIFSDVLKPCLYTSNPSGIPDSCKLFIFREQRCISWGVTTGCSPTNGHYLDNICMVLPEPKTGISDALSIDIWDWWNDAFPANETAGLPGSGVAFDTCGALIQNARNNAAGTGNLLRFDVPGDSILVKCNNATKTPLRLDLVFRILPGPGNYVTVGNKASALRKVPASTTAAVSGDNSFWGQYLADNGEYGTPGGHPGGVWSQNVWNSARCDTVEWNMFPVNGKTGNLPAISVDTWMTTLHEADPHFNTLGILKNRCFLVDTALTQPNNSLNTTCSSVPVWLTDPAFQVRAGYDAAVGPQTREYTKVFPDGLLTAGSHIEYFLRLAHTATPTSFVMCPDTTTITPQPTGSAWNYDYVRWEGISILPDRWKDGGYGGLGSACMLVVDYQDRRGGEGPWVGAMDSIGATTAAKYGAHNGWHATAAYIAPDGSHDFYAENVANDNTICVYTHGGQPGTTWDLYNVKAAESSTTGAAQIGSRLANRAGMGLMTGKQSMQGPTPEMLRTYYKMLHILSGNLNNRFFGAVTDRGQDDVALVQDFLTYGADALNPRGIWVMGHGFMEGNTGIDAAHSAFLTGNLGCSLRDPSYYALAGSPTNRFPDLIPTSVITTNGATYCVQAGCGWTNDVLNVNTAVFGATAASYYQNLGAAGPYVSGVYVPSSTSHPYVSLTDGWNIETMFSRYGGNTVGRLQYFMNVLVNVFGAVCPFTPTPTVDVPTNTVRNVDFLGNVWGNPMVAGGQATVNFSLAKPDRVEVKVYDVTGRLVKSLADRSFTEGPHKLTWDGTNDQGQVVARGVYFTQVKFINSRFVDAKKVTVLK